VDLEQREGRVHRYKGHAVRKNLALRYGREALKAAARAKREPTRPDNDPWEYVFDAGKRDRPAKATDLVPFWVYAVDGGARVERHVPTLPLSRDVDRLEALRRSLALYRIVFGQPRQEDLLAFLLTHIPEEQARQALADLRIDLAPPKADTAPNRSASLRSLAPRKILRAFSWPLAALSYLGRGRRDPACKPDHHQT
jgi:hypothetical protein